MPVRKLLDNPDFANLLQALEELGVFVGEVREPSHTG